MHEVERGRWVDRLGYGRLGSREDLVVRQAEQPGADLGKRQVVALHPANETEAGQMPSAVSRRGSRRIGRRQQALRNVVAHGARRDIGEAREVGEAVGVVRHVSIMTVQRADVKTLAAVRLIRCSPTAIAGEDPPEFSWESRAAPDRSPRTRISRRRGTGKGRIAAKSGRKRSVRALRGASRTSIGRSWTTTR